MRTRAFIGACARLSDLDLSVENTTALTESVSVVMPPLYEMPQPTEWRETFQRNGAPPTATRRGQWHELVQHLTDLGYLSRTIFLSWHRQRERDEPPLRSQLEALFRAVATYWSEEDYVEKSRLAPFPPEGFGARSEWTERHLPILVFRLATYTSFDGELLLPPFYRVGALNCYNRSLAYRIRILFFFGREELSEKFVFDRSFFKYLHSLDSSLGGRLERYLPKRNDRTLHHRVVEVLADWDVLFTHFRRANALGYLVYDLGVPLGMEENSRRQERLRKRLNRRLDRAPLYHDSASNRIGIRILQIGLWRSGYYRGAVDGEFGVRSHLGLLEIIEQERSAQAPVLRRRQLDKLLFAAGGKVWAADLRLLAKMLAAYAPAKEAEMEKEETAIWKKLDRSTVSQDWEDEVLHRQREVSSAYPSVTGNPFRRVYYGLKSLIRSAFRIIKKVVDWFERKVVEIAGAVFSFVKAVVKRVQEGIGLFFEGFRYFGHYVLGRPFVTLGEERDGQRPVLATKLSIDFDVSNLANATATDADLATHRQFLVRMREGLDFFLEVVTQVIRFVGSLSTPLGWVKLGVLIARVVRDLLRRPRAVFA